MRYLILFLFILHNNGEAQAGWFTSFKYRNSCSASEKFSNELIKNCKKYYENDDLVLDELKNLESGKEKVLNVNYAEYETGDICQKIVDLEKKHHEIATELNKVHQIWVLTLSDSDKIKRGLNILDSIMEKNDSISCLMNCAQEKGSKKECFNVCKIEEAVFEQWFIQAGLGDSFARENLNVMVSNASSAISEMKLVFEKKKEIIEKIAATNPSSYRQKKKEIEKKREDLAQKASCKVLPLEQQTKAATVFSLHDTKRGSGFYVKTKIQEGKELGYYVTAHHVVISDPEIYEDFFPVVQSLSKPDVAEYPASEKTIEVKPGSFDRQNDIVAIAAFSPHSLPVVEVGEFPKPGATVYLNGYPAYNEHDFTKHTCKFFGYTPAFNGGDFSYLINCPSAFTSVGGTSGGPVLNEFGAVIGLASAQGINKGSYSRIIVAPLFADKQGQLRFGFAEPFLSSYCFPKIDDMRPSKCQIIPGLTNQKQIP